MRHIQSAVAEGNQRAQLALDVYIPSLTAAEFWKLSKMTF
jgi:hypothetical protein